MEILKLTLLALAVLVVAVGIFMIFTLLADKKQLKNQPDNCSSDNQTRSFGCGCGAGYCGQPIRHEKG